MFMFGLSYDLEFTLRRLAVTSGLLLVWAWLGSSYGLSFVQVLIVLIPNPLGFWGTLVELPSFYWGSWGLLYVPILFALQVAQAFAVVSLGLILWRRYRKDDGAALSAGRPIDTDQLKRPWFIVPAIMTVSTVVFCYLVVMVFVTVALRSLWRYDTSLPSIMAYFGYWPLVVGLAVSGIGLLLAWPQILGAQRFISAQTGTRVLPDDHPLTQRVHALAKRLDLPPPKVGATNVANAFAVGASRDHAMVVLGVPLVRGLTEAELDAVIGHELGHIISGDMQQMQFAESFQQGMGSLIGNFGRATTRQFAKSQTDASLGDGLSMLMRFSVLLGGEFAVKGFSRSREFYADAIGAAVSSPEAMASALQKISTITTAPTPVEQQYACLMFRGAVGQFLSTHPPTEKRIEALKSRAYYDILPRRDG